MGVVKETSIYANIFNETYLALNDEAQNNLERKDYYLGLMRALQIFDEKWQTILRDEDREKRFISKNKLIQAYRDRFEKSLDDPRVCKDAFDGVIDDSVAKFVEFLDSIE